ncbi:MAG: tail fiber domain-containing protein [Bacteroidota bacterium]
MKKIFLSIVSTLACWHMAYTQSVGIGTATPDVSAVLDLTATNKGLLIPRMTAQQKGLIPTPKAGLLVYQVDGVSGLYLYNGSNWISTIAAAGAGWSVGGNAGTDPFSNFIGTTDSKPLVFRVENAYAGRIGSDGIVALGRGAANSFSDSSIVAIGDKALYFNGTGINQNDQAKQNTAIGAKSLHKNTTGSSNTASGYQSGYSNTIGYGMTAIGTHALYFNTTGNSNTAVGSRSLYKNTIGSYNTASGVFALYDNTEGNYNTATGYQTLTNNTDGHNNTAHGFEALNNNSTGVYNTAMGSDALFHSQSGDGNTATGHRSLYMNTTGYGNVADGVRALYGNINGTYNVAAGYEALSDNTSGSENTANGYRALTSNTSGYSNVAVGTSALYQNVKQFNNVAIGDSALMNNGLNVTNQYYAIENTAVGSKAMYSNISGSDNTALGCFGLTDNITGHNNNAIGFNAMHGNQYGNYNNAFGNNSMGNNISGIANVAIGSGTMFTNTTGDFNTALGYTANVGSTSLDNATAIGAFSKVGCSNCMVLGSINGVNNATADTRVAIGTQTPQAMFHIKQYAEAYPINGPGLRMERKTNTNHWELGIDNGDDFDFNYNGASKAYIRETDGKYIEVSDIRMKKNILPVGSVLPGIMQLQAKTYHYKDNTANAPLAYGFIAQEVEQVFPDFVDTKGPDKMKAIAYQNFNVVAIKAIQEQQVIIENQNARIRDLEAKMDQLLKAVK